MPGYLILPTPGDSGTWEISHRTIEGSLVNTQQSNSENYTRKSKGQCRLIPDFALTNPGNKTRSSRQLILAILYFQVRSASARYFLKKETDFPGSTSSLRFPQERPVCPSGIPGFRLPHICRATRTVRQFRRLRRLL